MTAADEGIRGENRTFGRTRGRLTGNKPTSFPYLTPQLFTTGNIFYSVCDVNHVEEMFVLHFKTADFLTWEPLEKRSWSKWSF